MSYQSPLGRWFPVDRLDVTLARIVLVVSLLLLGLRFLASQVFLVVIPTSTGVGSALYLATRNRERRRRSLPSLPGTVTGYLPAVVFVALAALVLLARATGGRTAPVYLLTGAVGALILGEILLTSEADLSPGLVLTQILAATLLIRFTALYTTPGFVGVDVWTHVPVFVEAVAGSGSLSPLAGNKYVMAPFYHLIGAAGTLAFGSARMGVYLTLGALVPLSALFVYGAGVQFLSSRWALLATALYAFGDQFIRWGIHIIPTSLGLVFFLASLYCVTRVFFTDADPRPVALLVVFSLAVVFTHQVSTAILLVLLGVAAGVGVATDRLSDADGASGWLSASSVALTAVFLLDLVVTLVTWAHTPFSGVGAFLWRMLSVFRRFVLEQAGFLNLAGSGDAGGAAAAENPTLVAELIPFVELFGFALLLALVVLGGLVLLRDEPEDGSLVHLVAAGTMFAIVFGFSFFGVRLILPGRWMAFMYAPMAVVGAVGLYHVFGNAPRRLVVVAVVVLALGYPTTMVVAEKATLDSPAFDEQYPRFSYTDAELGAVETISAVHPPSTDEVIYSDHPYRTIFGPLGGYSSGTLVMHDGEPRSPGPVVYREYQATGPVSFHAPGDPPRESVQRNAGLATVCPADRNYVYDNDAVTLCTRSAVSEGDA